MHKYGQIINWSGNNMEWKQKQARQVLWQQRSLLNLQGGSKRNCTLRKFMKRDILKFNIEDYILKIQDMIVTTAGGFPFFSYE